MSLVVSLRVPDGIVVAADSLSTGQRLVELTIDPGMLAKIGKQKADEPKATIPIPFSASSYTQKLFPFHGSFAISVVGQGVVNNKSIYYLLKQFENSCKSEDIQDVTDKLIEHFEKELIQQYPKYKKGEDYV